jgi:hypothetical protein
MRCTRSDWVSDTQPSGEEPGNVGAAAGDPTGLTGCPAWWFASAFPGCRNDSQNFCWYNVAWAFAYHTKGIQGQGIVCADSGTAQLEVTGKSHLATYMVPAGHYTVVNVPTTTHSGWSWGCLCYRDDWTDQKFIKFDLKPNGANSQFKGYISHF